MTDAMKEMTERVMELDGLATPEPWRSKLNNPPYKCVWLDPEDNYTTLELKPEDADLIAYYRTAAPLLAAEVTRLAKELADAIAFIKGLNGQTHKHGRYYRSECGRFLAKALSTLTASEKPKEPSKV